MAKNIDFENMSEEFKDCYNKLDKNLVKEMDNYRKKSVNAEIMVITSLIVFGVTFLILILNIFFVNKITLQAIILFLIFLFSTSVGIIWGALDILVYEKAYIEKLKKEMIPQFIKIVNPNLKYFSHERNYGGPSNSDRLSEYNNAGYDDIVATELIKDADIIGKLDNNSTFRISEIEVYQEYINESGEHIRWLTFEGFFSWNETNIDIKNCMKISINDDAAEQINKVQMDSSNFEKIFDVYCDDRILAMRILTVDVMELLMEFYSKYNLGFEICYKNNKIYIRFFSERLFNPRHSSSANNMYKYYSIFKFSMDFVKKVTKSVEDIGL